MTLTRIQEAADVIARGGLIVYPTDTLWGLGASVADEAAVRRVFAVKKRPPSEPLSIAVESVDAISDYARVTRAAQRLFPLLPGALTIVLEKTPRVPDVVERARVAVAVPVRARAGEGAREM